MASLDSILNVVIPGGILVFGAFYFYKLLKDPIDSFIDWIKGLFGKGKGKVEETFGDEGQYQYFPKEFGRNNK